jgi:hypothetical protein
MRVADRPNMNVPKAFGIDRSVVSMGNAQIRSFYGECANYAGCEAGHSMNLLKPALAAMACYGLVRQ